MMAQNTKILYTYLEPRSFVKNDIAMLKKHFDVTAYRFDSKKKWKTPFAFIFQFFYLLLTGWRYRYQVVFFAGYHSILPVLFSKWLGKKSILFLGGTDCFNYPSFHYGNFTRRYYGRSTCFSVRNASLLVPVSENLIYSESNYYEKDSPIQGVQHWCKPLDTPHTTIVLEYDPGLFYRRPIERIENSFITVAFGIQGTSFIRKGIDKFLMLAKQFPENTFTIIGCHREEFPVDIPANVTLIPPVPYESLPEHYSRHQFYLQLSIVEGFPSAICEAMLCECIPIGSSVAAIPSIIGENGYLVDKRDDEIILQTVRQAIHAADKPGLGKAAREHIIHHFGKGKREERLLELFRR